MNTATNAVNNPVRRRSPEINTGELPIGERKTIIMPEAGLPDRENIVVADKTDARLDNKLMKDLLFNEEPVEIIIAKGEGKYPEPAVLCAVNGKGAEQLINGVWVSKGWLPTEVPVVTKRKYVEVLIRAKPQSVKTFAPKLSTDDVEAGKQENTIKFNTTRANQISIIGDPNPAGRDWVAKLMREG